MSGSMGKSESASESESGFKQEVWPGQASYLESLYGQAGGVNSNVQNSLYGQMPGATNYMNQVRDDANPAWQNQMQGGAYQDMNLQNTLMDSLNQSLNNPSAMSEVNAMIMGGDGNNYADAMRSQYMQDASRAQNQMMSNMDQRAVMNGQSGSSRHGVAQANGMEDINRNLQRNMAETGYNTFDKDLDRKLQIAGMADQNTLARQGMMGDMIGSQNQAMQSGLNSSQDMQNLGMGSLAPTMMPWQSMSNYANVLGQPTILGSGDMFGNSDSKGLSLAGGM